MVVWHGEKPGWAEVVPSSVVQPWDRISSLAVSLSPFIPFQVWVNMSGTASLSQLTDSEHVLHDAREKRREETTGITTLVGRQVSGILSSSAWQQQEVYSSVYLFHLLPWHPPPTSFSYHIPSCPLQPTLWPYFSYSAAKVAAGKQLCRASTPLNWPFTWFSS